MNFTCDSLCFGCGTNHPNKFISLKRKGCDLSFHLCMECFTLNKTHKYFNCYYCEKIVKLDYTQLKLGDIIQGGMAAFNLCLKCLCNTGDISTSEKWFGMMDLTDEMPDTHRPHYYDEFGDEDETQSEEYNEEGKSEKIEDRPINVIFDKDAELKKAQEIQKKERAVILKTISNCRTLDKKKLKNDSLPLCDHIGNLTYENVMELLEEQDYTCAHCDEIVLTHSTAPYCNYKFSIDRIDNLKPHDIDNVRISCVFCNCGFHPAFGKRMKTKCEDSSCSCNSLK